MRYSHRYSSRQDYATLTAQDGVLRLASSYNAGLVAWIKTIPAQDRRFEPEARIWYIDPKHGIALQAAIRQNMGIAIEVPHVMTQQREVQRTIEVRYIGAAKDHGSGQTEAFGFHDGGWTVILPELVLRKWFGEADVKPGQAATHYGVLGISSLSGLDEIKRAYRKLSKVWHPDINHDVDATAQFRAVKHAHEVLSDSIKRGKYDAGLRLQATLPSEAYRWAYRAPLTCGKIVAKGLDKMGRLVVEEILSWQDITDSQGRVLVTSWPKGATMFEEKWVEVNNNDGDIPNSN